MAEQLLASQEGLFCIKSIFIHFNDFDLYILGNMQSRYIITSFDESVYHSSS